MQKDNIRIWRAARQLINKSDVLTHQRRRKVSERRRDDIYANYIVERFEKRKAAKGVKSVLKDGKKCAEELDVAFTYDETKATLTSQGRRPK